MGCKQYARMLGLSRGYPHILYPSLNKWDAAPLRALSTQDGLTFLSTRCAPILFDLFRSREIHGHVNIFKNFARRNSLSAVGRFDQIVACLTAMFAAKYIPELKRCGELPGPNQKSRAINMPFAFCFLHCTPPF